MDKPTTQNSVKSSATVFKILRGILRFSLLIFVAMLEGSMKARRKRHTPNFDELWNGERIPGSDKCFFSDQKFHK